MKKISILIIVCICTIQLTHSQVSPNDFGRIVINSYLPEEINISSEAKQLLETKLNQITSNYGIGGSSVNPRFIITANVNIISKNIIAGPPQMVSKKLDITLFVGDAITNTVFSNTTITVNGVGNNENTAFIDAFNVINTKNKNIETFISEGKNKIIEYYNSQCEHTINHAISLASQQEYREAIYELSLVPEVCKDCYLKCQNKTAEIYQSMIDAEGEQLLLKAKSTWLSLKDEVGAKNAYEILCKINPKAKCHFDVEQFYKTIESKLDADEKRERDTEMKVYNDDLELRKATLKAYRDVAMEYAKHQPKTITYNNIFWR